MPHQLLLADGSITIQRVMRLTFADEDVNVMTFSDGNLALAAIDQSPPDIVLADIGLAGRNGYDIARHLRDTPRLAHIPVVLLTSAFNALDEALATAVGCDRVLAKPFDPQAVISCVRELLAGPGKIARPAASFQLIKALESDASPSAGSDADLDRLDLAFSNAADLPAPAAIGRLDAFAIEVEDLEPAVVPAEPSGVGHTTVEPFSYAPDLAAFDHPFETTGADARVAGWEDDSQTAAARALFEAAEPSRVPPLVSDALIDEIATRVIDCLMTRMSSGSVPDVVAAIAERLVREEIDRIKSRL